LGKTRSVPVRFFQWGIPGLWRVFFAGFPGALKIELFIISSVSEQQPLKNISKTPKNLKFSNDPGISMVFLGIVFFIQGI
jgi:hypothetical protein